MDERKETMAEQTERHLIIREDTNGLMQALQVINAKGDEGEIEEILADAQVNREQRNAGEEAGE
ncbi:MAG TPA: hypothetical protein VFV52_14035 [Bacilli bacterium]|nr:hypothetical protein [Bacilli bacterium]